MQSFNLDPYVYENGFYLNCPSKRIGKLLVHYQLYSRISEIPGSFIELGVFKGASFLKFLKLRELLEKGRERNFLAFDTFGDFPETAHPGDREKRKQFIESAGSKSISETEFNDLLKIQGLDKNVKTIAGDITKTLPSFLEGNPEIRFALIHLDVDIYEPCVAALHHCWPRLLRGGILVLDDYGFFPGTTEAVDNFFSEYENFEILSSPLSPAPCWIVKK